MPRSAKLRWTARTIAFPLLASLAVHVLLFLALWYWPTWTRSPTLTIQSTRILLDTCVLDAPSSTLLAGGELPAELRGPSVDTLAPRLEGPTLPPTRKRPTTVPGTSNSSGNTEGDKNPTKNGHGIGNGSQTNSDLFSVPATAGSVVYVLDHSLSMGTDGKLDAACRELIASLQQLPASVRFQVIVYNNYVEPLMVDGQRDLLPAEPANVAKAISHLQALYAAGKTNHLVALRCGIALHPDLLYLLTDASDLKPEEVAFITRWNLRTALHTIELTRRSTTQPDNPLFQLARDNHGTYHRVWLGN